MKAFVVSILLVICFFLIGCAFRTGECIEGDCKNGYGTLIFPDGREYVGQFEGSWKHGQGTMTYPDGRKYVGKFKKGKFIGK